LRNKNILFISDSSSNIGTGHIMRDLVLASKYKKSNITFATHKLKGNINHKIKEAGYKVKIIKSNKVNEIIKLVKKLDIDLVVIDNYKINYKYEKKLKDKTNVKILVLDDTYEKHYCDILLNHNIYAKTKKYKKLVPKKCELRCGAKYTLLRDEFIKAKKRHYKKSKKINIFISMGGSDTAQLNIPILKALKKYTDIKINLVTTTANKNLNKLKKYSKNKQNIKLHVDSKKIAKIMAKSSLAIVTPSVVLNEVFFMGLEFIAIQTAKNQNEMFKYIKKLNK